MKALFTGSMRRWFTTLHEARRRLLMQGVLSTEINTLLCHAHVPPISREEIFLNPAKSIDDTTQQRLESLITRRLQGEPMAYVVGMKEFWSLPFRVTRDTLIPRPETELLIELLMQLQPREASFRILDLGTGSGCLTVAALVEHPNAHAVAIDISQSALRIAEENAKSHGVKSRASFIEMDMRDLTNHFGPNDKFDIVLCNPPYIAHNETPDMGEDVVAFEPHHALYAENNGLELYELLAPQLKDLIHEGGHVLFEVGFRQANIVHDMYINHGFQRSSQLNDTIFKDLQDIDRSLVLQRDST